MSSHPSIRFHWRRWAWHAALLLAGAAPQAGRLSAAETPPTAAEPAVSREVVDRLIRELGAEQFARRERAQAELQRLGLAAFDALNDAQDSDDIEIALRARYVLRTLDIRWFQDSDPVAVKELLRGYADKSLSERGNLMDQLAELPEGRGTAALCRLVRFDASLLLSKRAALSVMRLPAPGDAALRGSWGQSIRDELGTSGRVAADWLRTFVRSLGDEAATVDDWERLSLREEEVYHLTPEKSSGDIVRDLLRWRAGLLDRIGRTQESLAVVMRTIDLLDGSREQVLETVDWLMQRKAYDTVELVARRFAERFQQSPTLAYRLAESQLKQGKTELAEETAQRAAALNPENPQEHILAAYTLQEHGLFDWAEREYRQILQRGPAGSPEDLRTRFLLSEMLHDLQRELEAAQVLQGASDVLDKDQNAVHQIARLGRDPGGMRSRMHYFYAEHQRLQGNSPKQREHLQEAVKHDNTDADVLIAMYRVADSDPAWKEMTANLIRDAAAEFRAEIRAGEQQAAAAPNDEIRELYNRQLAQSHNQLAWLLSNTTGDYDEALRSSLRSLDLHPKSAGYLDTLGRCYYAKGDYENAVRTQAEAVELEPHSCQIRRQLELFQAALNKP